MKNPDFIGLLRLEKDEAGKPYTIEKLAESIWESRPHVNKVILGYQGDSRHSVAKQNFGRFTRRKLIKFFKKQFVTWPAMLAALRWDEHGNKIVPHGT